MKHYVVTTDGRTFIVLAKDEDDAKSLVQSDKEKKVVLLAHHRTSNIVSV